MGKLSHTHVCVTKQYSLVPTKGWTHVLSQWPYDMDVSTPLYDSVWTTVPCLSKARFPFKRNRLRCVRCVNENRKNNAGACVCKQPIMVATASTEHSYWLALAFVASRNASDCVWVETGLDATTILRTATRCFAVAGRVSEPAARQRTSTDSDEASSAATMDEVTVKRELEQVPASNPSSSSSTSSVTADQEMKITCKQEMDRSTSNCDKVLLLIS